MSDNSSHISAAGFEYIDGEDTARCKQCGFKVFGCTSDMDPFDIHYKQKPDCPCVHSNTTSVLSHPFSSLPQPINDQKNPPERQKLHKLHEEDKRFEQARINTFSHWPKYNIPSSKQMIKAGFYSCNVRDRVICMSCNLICQRWIPHTDYPCEVHRTLSPDCSYVKRRLLRPEPPPIINIDERSIGAISNSYSMTPANLVLIAAHHPDYIEIPKRLASFGTWPDENPTSLDDLVQAGFFYTLNGTRVTCFYCNGSLRNWDSSHTPMIEHARWFPQCAYARQLCGDELYRKIQESERAGQERVRANAMEQKVDPIPLSKEIEARLDLPISKSFLARNFELSTIRRCWEDQLRLKQEDFTSDVDLYIACLVLEKQIKHIDEKKNDVIIPSESMRQHREQAMKEHEEILLQKQAEVPVNAEISNPCVRCWKKEKQLTCIPCGHLGTCIPCGQELHQCPICRRGIDAFVRVYL